jgi:hypothetical protein
MNKTTLLVVGCVILATIVATFFLSGNPTGINTASIPLNSNTRDASTTGTSTHPITQTPTPAMQTTKTLAIGESVTVQGLTATPIEVVEDSRCPKDVQCIQAGTVKVNVRLSYFGFSVKQVFTLGAPVSARGVTGELTAVTPEKLEGQDIKPLDYRLTFTVSKS